jgi:predicted Ser/Thr protein kinase
VGSQPVCPVCSSPVTPGQQVCSICSHRFVASPIHLRTTAPSAGEPAAPRGPAPPFPRRVGDFTLLEPLGRGGSATVYLAYQESMRRRVALKVLAAEGPGSGPDEVRFEQEAWIAGKLSHPHIVRVYERGHEGSSRFIVMEYVEGRSLAAFIEETRARQALSRTSDSEWRRGHVRRVVAWFVDAADALEYVHRQGVIHRDIKPLNLLLADGDTRILLTDFGLARDAASERMTVRGDFMGTIRYMSPEQLLAHRAKVDHRTDLWSLGVSLYEAITLDLPFSADSEEGYIGAVASKDPVPARRRERAVPKDLETIVMKCLERDPEQRYATAAEFRDDCRRYLSDQPVSARRPGVIIRSLRFGKRRRGLIAGLAAASVLAVAATYVVLASLASAREDNRAQADAMRTRERVRQTLNQVRLTGVAPDQLVPDWNTLAALLREEVGRDPRGELANEARVATLSVAARIGSPIDMQSRLSADPTFDLGELARHVPFGLLSSPPMIHLVVGRIFDISVPLRTVVHLEASVDGKPFTALGWTTVLFGDGGRFIRRSGLCSFALPAAALVAGPHRLEFRATITFPEEPNPQPFQASCVTSAVPPKTVDRVSMIRPMVVPLQPSTVSLFTEYPPDFPQQVAATATAMPVDSWFRPERLRLIQVRLPQRSGSAILASDPWQTSTSGTVAVIRCAPPAITPAAAVIGIVVSGQLSATPPIPIAASLDWRPVDGQATLLSFPVVAGGGVFHFGGPPSAFGVTDPRGLAGSGPLAHLRLRADGFLAPLGTARGRAPIEIPLDLRFTAGAAQRRERQIVFREPLWQRELMKEQVVAGVLELRPDRDLALAHFFERYLSDLRREVPLEIQTVDGGWTHDRTCPSAGGPR